MVIDKMRIIGLHLWLNMKSNCPTILMHMDEFNNNLCL